MISRSKSQNFRRCAAQTTRARALRARAAALRAPAHQTPLEPKGSALTGLEPKGSDPHPPPQGRVKGYVPVPLRFQYPMAIRGCPRAKAKSDLFVIARADA